MTAASTTSSDTAECCRLLAGPGLSIRTGPFAYRLRSDAPPLAKPLSALYRGYPQVGAAEFHDFDVQISRGKGIRGLLRPQVRFRYDGVAPFEPLPLAHAFPMLEWAMNWCISTQINQYLLIHAAVVERGGHALILPAPPGSGKSTLCAALIHRGWRLLSDEIAMIAFDDLRVQPLVRPVSLKNRSIDVIAAFEPGAQFNTPVPNTSKGTVAHMRVPQAQVQRMDELALPAWIVCPRWQAGAPARLSPRDPAETVIHLARNSFNYGTLGLRGFETMTALVKACECHDFQYGQLDDAMAVFGTLAGAC